MGNMQKKKNKAFATSNKYDNLQNVYWTIVGISNPGNKIPEFIQGLWDTGCTITTISKKVADALGLPVICKEKCNTAGGSIECNRHMVDIFLLNRLVVHNVVIMSNPILAVDCLVGTDIIIHGDFSVSNFDGKTTVSFRMPSQEDVDYAK